MSDSVAESVTVYVCHGCRAVVQEDSVEEAGPLYECGSCGIRFTRSTSYNDNHQCPDCTKFSTKEAEYACPVCEEEALEEEEGYVLCPHCADPFLPETKLPSGEYQCPSCGGHVVVEEEDKAQV